MAKSFGGVRELITTLKPEQASNKIKSIVREIKDNGFSTAQPFTIGYVEPEVLQFARAHNIELGSNEIVMTPKQIVHTLRDSKAKIGKGINGNHLAEFPLRRVLMEVYYDSTNPALIYFDRQRQEKFIVHNNYLLRIKNQKGRVVNYITAGKTDAREFNMAKYVRIK